MEHEFLPEKTSDIEAEARKRVQDLKDFYIHLGIYALVNVFLIVLNLLTSPDVFWAIWPILGWGIGLGAHAIHVFGLFGIGNRDWEERKVRELMLQRQQGLSAEQVRQLLHEELQAESSTSQDTVERMRQRLENLEAIVTSKEWDLLEASTEAAPPPLLDADLDQDADPQDLSDQAAKIARRIQ